MEKIRFLTATELAAFLGVTEEDVMAMVAKFEIPHYHFGKSVRFDGDEIESWLSTRHHRVRSK